MKHIRGYLTVVTAVAVLTMAAAGSSSAAMNNKGYFPPAKGAKIAHGRTGNAAHQTVRTMGKRKNDFANLNR